MSATLTKALKRMNAVETRFNGEWKINTDVAVVLTFRNDLPFETVAGKNYLIELDGEWFDLRRQWDTAEGKYLWIVRRTNKRRTKSGVEYSQDYGDSLDLAWD